MEEKKKKWLAASRVEKLLVQPETRKLFLTTHGKLTHFLCP
jgi:hypothetical protein